MKSDTPVARFGPGDDNHGPLAMVVLLYEAGYSFSDAVRIALSLHS